MLYFNRKSAIADLKSHQPFLGEGCKFERRTQDFLEDEGFFLYSCSWEFR
jgi:hypothetical protein